MKLTPEKLYNDGIGYIKDNFDNLDDVLNAEPNPQWLEKESIGGKDVFNLSIEKTEFILNRLFRNVIIEVKELKVQEGIGSILVRVHYTNRDGEKMFQDGVASCDAKDTTARSMMPALKSVAIKDSCHHLGRIFGRDLNRKNTIKSKKKVAIDLDNVKELFEQKKSILSKEDFEAATRIITEQEVNSYRKLYESLKQA